jgi:gas vesicle protein
MEETPMNERERSNERVGPNGIVVGFLCGAALGAGIALLTAPSSGEVTRRRLRATAEKVGNATRERFAQIRGRFGELRHDLKDSVAHGAEEMGVASSR